MKIHILRTQNSETVPKLVKHIKKCEESYEYPEDDCFVINYGRTNNKGHLNNSIVSNKLEQLTSLRNAGIRVPHTFILPPKAFKQHHFPLLARKFKHSKGQDIIFLKTKRSLQKRLPRVKTRNFFVEYVDKEAEFRVHVLGEEVPNICQKVPSDNSTEHHPHVWCSPRGWTLTDYDGNHSEALKELGKKATKVLGYDFGAVDIGLGKDGHFYVFEINSAPRLNRSRRRFYAKYFRQKEKEHRKKLKEKT